MLSYKNLLIEAELRNFIMNTNNLISINNGPWPNTALQYSSYLLYKIAEKRKKNVNQKICTMFYIFNGICFGEDEWYDIRSLPIQK